MLLPAEAIIIGPLFLVFLLNSQEVGLKWVGYKNSGELKFKIKATLDFELKAPGHV
jgi:hypothetical protein